MAVGAEVFETVHWSGRFTEALWPTPVVQLPRRAVKLHLCGSARAKDPNIRQALLDRFGARPPPAQAVARPAARHSRRPVGGARRGGHLLPRRAHDPPRPGCALVLLGLAAFWGGVAFVVLRWAS